MAAMDLHTYDNTLYEKVYQTAYQAAAELIENAGMKAGQILVVGCSTSEVGGEKIGTYSSPELAAKVFGGIYAAVQEKGIYLAAQCCEHLNRALILETEAAEKYGYEPVNVMPQPKAGGSFATAAWHAFADPVAVEHIAAPCRNGYRRYADRDASKGCGGSGQTVHSTDRGGTSGMRTDAAEICRRGSGGL